MFHYLVRILLNVNVNPTTYSAKEVHEKKQKQTKNKQKRQTEKRHNDWNKGILEQNILPSIIKMKTVLF